MANLILYIQILLVVIQCYPKLTMISTIKKHTDLLQKAIEDPNQPLLGRNVYLLKISGLLPDYNKNELKYMIHHILMTTFVLTQYVEVYITRSDVLKLLQNIKYSINATMIMWKVISFLLWRNKWKSIIDFVIEVNAERCTSKDKISKDINIRHIKYSRFITYFLLYLTLCTVLMILFQPMAEYYFLSDNTERSDKYITIIPSWVPFSTDNLVGYLATISYQVYATLYTGIYIVSYDSTAICIMIFFRGEFELLRRDCQNLFGTANNPATKAIAKIHIIKCHKRYNELMKYVKLFDSCLSPIMLLYMIVCSVMLCATAYQLTVETSAMQKFITAEYLIFGVAQLFLYCWHSNEVVYVSTELMLGPYESMWWTRSLSEQKDINILTRQFNKVIVFSAGPFTHITVATFISILKGAYSYYTLLSQSQEN